MLDRALAWSRAGWPVFPCNNNGVPALTEWQKKATTDEATIRAWDWEDKRVATVPGLAGCFVIDVDVKNGKDGETSLAKLEAEHGFEAWEFPQQSTPSGGRHIFFQGVFSTSVQRRLGSGIDTRGGSRAGGLGFVYCYSDDAPGAPGGLPLAPASLLALTQPEKDRSEDAQTPRVELDQPANVERALAYIKDLPSPEEGERNMAVFKTACTLKDLGLSLSKIFEVLEEYPSVTGIPPLCQENPEEFNATVRSAYRNGQRQPGIDAIDEESRNKAAEGFDLGEARQVGEAKGAGGRKRLGLWSERKGRAPPAWLVRGLLTKSSLAGLYGPGGSYKSFIALDMAAAIATGVETWGGRAVAHGPVVFISGEGSVEPRALAIETRGITITDNFAILDGINLDDMDQLMEAVEDINTAVAENWVGQVPALIVVDTLARAAPGQDENSARDMGRVVQSCDGFRKLYGCCVLLVHHTPKGGHDWRDGGVERPRHRPVGEAHRAQQRHAEGGEAEGWRNRAGVEDRAGGGGNGP